MWKIQKYNMCKIIDESNGNIIVTELDENQAKSIIDKHNTEINTLKWGKDKKDD